MWAEDCLIQTAGPCPSGVRCFSIRSRSREVSDLLELRIIKSFQPDPLLYHHHASSDCYNGCYFRKRPAPSRAYHMQTMRDLPVPPNNHLALRHHQARDQIEDEHPGIKDAESLAMDNSEQKRLQDRTRSQVAASIRRTSHQFLSNAPTRTPLLIHLLSSPSHGKPASSSSSPAPA